MPYTINATPTPSEAASCFGLRTPTPSVFVIPPEEEQEDTPPWCCYDPDDEDDAESPVDSEDLAHHAEMDIDAPTFRSSESLPLDEVTMLPRRHSVRYTVTDLQTAAMSAGDVEADEDVVEVVRVGRKRAGQQEADVQDEATAKGDTGKKTKPAFAFRSRAAQAFKSMRKISSGSAKNAPKPHMQTKEAPSQAENAQMPSKLRKKLSLDTQRPARGVPKGDRVPFASFQAPRSKTAPTLKRRLSQLFTLPSRSTSDVSNPSDTAAAASSSHPEFGQTLSSTYSSSISDLGTDVRARPSTSLGVYPIRRDFGDGLSEPPLANGASRRFSMTNLKTFFAGGSTVSVGGGTEPIVQSAARVAFTPSSSAQMSPSSSSFSPWLGSLDSPPTLDPVTLEPGGMLMSRTGTNESEASTEPPETPTDAEGLADATMEGPYAFVEEGGRDSHVRMSSAASAVLAARARAEKERGEDGDESVEMRLDSLHFESLRFDAGEFEISF